MEGEWLCSQISYIIKNEKYYGDMILQKTFVEGGVKYAKPRRAGQILCGK